MSACSEPAPVLQASLHGAATLDMARQPTFVAGGKAVVRVPVGSGYRVELVGESERHAASISEEPRDGAVLLRVRLPEVPAADYTLRVHAPKRRPSEHRIRVRPSPKSLLVEHRTRIAKAPVDQRASLWAQTKLAEPDAHWARVELARAHRAAGDHDASVQAWLKAAAATPPTLASERSRCLRAAAHGLVWARRLDQVDVLLDEAEKLDVADDAGRSRIAFYRGLLALERGDYRTAIDATDRASALAHRVGFDAGWVTAEEQRSAILVRQGRFAEARTRLAPLTEWTQAHGSPADRARLATNRAWTEIAGARLGHEGDLTAAQRGLEAVLAEAPQAWYAGNVRANLATIALLQRDIAGARRHLDAAMAQEKIGYTTLLAGEVALAGGRLAKAVETFEDALRLSLAESGDGRDDVQWRALHGAARVAAKEQRDAGPLFTKALDALAAVGARTEVLQDRAPFFTGRRALVDDAAAYFLANGQPGRAFEVLDSARGRVLRALTARGALAGLSDKQRAQLAVMDRSYESLRALTVEVAAKCARAVDNQLAKCRTRLAGERGRATRAFDQRQAFLDRLGATSAQVSADEIGRALPAGAALVAVHRVRGQLHAFVLENGTLRHEPVADGLSALNGVAAARIYATGEVTGLHREKPVAYLPFAGLLQAEARTGGGSALVVADPTRDLPGALAEGRAVSKRLGGTALYGDAATEAAVLDALDGARLFHFAGHGVLRAEAPWDTHLALAGGGRLALTTLFVRRPRAGVVVLSGCETGAEQRLAGAESVSLADGFLLAGGQAVLATDRKVDDQAARRFVDAFYAAGGADQPMHAYLTARAALAADPTAAAFQLTARP